MTEDELKEIVSLVFEFLNYDMDCEDNQELLEDCVEYVERN